MSYVAGIDYSTHAIDVVLLDENGVEPPEWHRTELVGNNAFDRTRSIDNGVTSAWWDDMLAIGIEDPRGFNAGALYRIQGAILANIPDRILVQPWVPSEWRKAVGLKGNAPKAEVKSAVITWAWAGGSGEWPQDACDAYCIALATLRAIRVEAAA